MSGSKLSLLVAVVLCGLSAGFFFTYEASVTLGLADVDDETYVTLFQAINDNIRNPAFAATFFGSLPAIVVALAFNWNRGSVRRRLIAGSLALYAALIAITGTGNVPLNNDLADYTVITAESAAEARAAFEDDWNRLNLLRTIAVTAGFVLLATAAVISPARGQDARADGRAGPAQGVAVARG